MADARRRLLRAAGGVVWRPRADGAPGVEVALVHRPKYDDWSLPKGKLDPGEPAVVGGCREVVEETGLQVVAGRALGESRYRVVAGGREVPKSVRWWAMRALGGDFTASEEVDQLRWLAPDRALRALTGGHDGAPLRLFVTEPPTTRTLLLVRHATAGSRRDGDGDDDLRPLDARGRAQADRLVPLLSAYGPERLLSAPLVRCVDTVRPLSAATGLPVQHEPLLAGAAYAVAAQRTHERLRSLVRETPCAVACSQGEVLPDAVRALAAGGRADEPPTWDTPKAGVWALSFGSDGCLVDADPVLDAAG